MEYGWYRADNLLGVLCDEVIDLFRTVRLNYTEEAHVYRLLAGLVCIVLTGSLALAAAPVGAVSSSSAFDLRGSEVKVDGVPSWPVLAGDVIATKVAPATILFKDGSRVILESNSKARVESTGDGLSVRLLDGDMDVLTAPGSTLRFWSRNTPVQAPAGVETAASTGKPAPPRHALLLPPPPSPVSTR